MVEDINRGKNLTGHFYFARNRTFLNWVDTDFNVC
jgi:hypothetical protein